MQESVIDKAIDILSSGGLVAIPTETVYGLGADARNPIAIRKIFTAKQRPLDHPLIVHLGGRDEMAGWAVDISPEALLLAETFWPGPLTLILKKAPRVLDIVTGGQDTIGLRIPNHPVALALLQQYAKKTGGGVAAPSANRFGRISPTTTDAVREELGETVDYILEGGQCDVGVESTIVDVSGVTPVILRPGMITAKQIEAVLHAPLATRQKNTPRVSGSMESHYAPRTHTVLMSTVDLQIFLDEADSETAVLTWQDFQKKHSHMFQLSARPEKYAHDLYQLLRELDKKGFKQIVIEAVPDAVEWDAIRDRLQRATSIKNS